MEAQKQPGRLRSGRAAHEPGTQLPSCCSSVMQVVLKQTRAKLKCKQRLNAVQAFRPPPKTQELEVDSVSYCDLAVSVVVPLGERTDMAETTSTKRKVVPLRENYFCDGAYYLITSSSLGGFTPEALAAKVSGSAESDMSELISSGVCIPVAFQGDCAMDRAVIVVGELTAQEDSEWIGKITGRLKIPCGKLIVTCGGGDAETLHGAVSGKGLGASNFTDYFQVVEIPAGDYLAEVYAYYPSIHGNFFFCKDEYDSDTEPMGEWKKWYEETRAGEPLPPWLEEFGDYAMPGELDELVSYIIRLKPHEGASVPEPQLDEDTGWAAFVMRKPEKAPVGVRRADL